MSKGRCCLSSRNSATDFGVISHHDKNVAGKGDQFDDGTVLLPGDRRAAFMTEVTGHHFGDNHQVGNLAAGFVQEREAQAGMTTSG